MKEIKITDKILNCSHKDLDGCVSNLLVCSVFKNTTSIFTNFEEINNYLVTINYDKYDWIILTDIHPMNEEYLKNPKIILLDHHESALDLHDPSKNRFVIPSMCGAKLTQRFLERCFNLDLSKFDNLIYLTQDYDLWIHSNKKSKLLNELFFHYWEDKFKQRFANGSTRFTKDEIEYLRYKIKEFNKVFDTLEIHEIPQINGCMIVTDAFLNDCCEKLLKNDYNFVISLNPKNKHISIRHNIENFNCGNFLKLLDLGGGHAQACGLTEDNFATAQERIEKFIEALSQILIFKRKQ